MDTAAFRHDFFLILPEVELALFGLAILLFDFMLGVKDKAGNAVFAMLGVIFSGISLYRLRPLGPGAVGGFNSSIVVDPFFLFFGMIFLIATALVILLSVRYLQIENEHHGEYYALLLFATVGMMFMASGYDLIVQFLGLETMAISFYILTGFLRGQRRSNEAAVKYLLLGAFSSGLLAYAFWSVRVNWVGIIAAVAIASLTLGNFAAITQTNVKRLLAYSSISHVGYILLGLVAAMSGPNGNETGLKGIAFYLFVYAFMTIGAFAIIIVLRRQGLIGDELDDLNGLFQRSPASAVLLLIFMLSLAGIPPLAGFVGKYYIFLALIETGHYYLALFGALYIVPALYYYFRIVVHAWLREPVGEARTRVTPGQSVALAVMCFVTVIAGIYPEPFIRLATYSLTLPSVLFAR